MGLPALFSRSAKANPVISLVAPNEGHGMGDASRQAIKELLAKLSSN